MLLQTFGDRNERPDKHPRVPAIATAVEIFQCAVEVRFFDELFGAKETGFVGFGPLRRREGLTNGDVTITRRGFGWFDTNGYDGLSATRQVKSITQNLLKFLLFWNDMVGRQDGHYSRSRAGSHQCRAQSYGSCRIA